MFSPTRYGESGKMTGQRQNVGIHTNCQKSLSRQCPQGLWEFNCHSPLQEIRIFTPLNPLGGLCQPTHAQWPYAAKLSRSACTTWQGQWQSQVQALGLCGESVPTGGSSDSQTVPTGGLKAPSTVSGLPSENLLGTFRFLPREQYESPWNHP